MGILPKMERSTIRAMCGVHLKDRNRVKDLMQTLGLNDTIGQQVMENCVFVWACDE